MRRSHAALVILISILSYTVAACADQQDASNVTTLLAKATPETITPDEAWGREAARSESETTISDIAERAVPSVVNISSQKVVQNSGNAPDFGPFFNDPFFRRFFGPGFGPEGHSFPQERRTNSLGSGVIVDANGTVLTNNHVIEDATEVRVTLADGRSFEAKIVGTDPESDIGVVKLQDPPDDLVALPFGDSEKLRLGSTVLAIGNPFGVGQTVTMGIVSAKGRANVGIVDYEDFIQTDAAINPGNSGGALVNTRGELVGINTAILSRSGGYQGIGFAIPSNMARQIMDSLVDTGKVVRGWLGVMIQDLNPDLAKALDLPKGTQGALVSEVVKGSPAEKGGIEQGDVVVAMDGVEIDSSSKLRNRVAAAPVNKDVKFEVLRGGKHKTLRVALGEREPQVAARTQGGGGTPLGGLTLAPVDSELAGRFGLPDDAKGVVVVRIDPDSEAARGGFRPGDLILEVDRKAVTSIDDFRKRYEASDDGLAVLVQRGEGRLYLVLKKGS